MPLLLQLRHHARCTRRIEELLEHPAGAGLRRPLHPGRRARAGAGADEHQRLPPGPRRTPIAEAIGGFRFTAGFGKTLSRLVRHGIGVHHAGMLPEVPAAGRDARPGRAAQGHLRHRHPRRRHQRADPHRAVHRAVQVRRHEDPAAAAPASSTRSPAGPGGPASTRAGTVVVQAPEHVIENERALAKAGDDPKKRRKVVRKKPPRGLGRLGPADLRPAGRRRAGAAAAPASRSATRCCSTSSTGPATPSRPCGTCSPTTTRTAAAQRRHIRRAIAIYRALLAGGVVERLRRAGRGRPARPAHRRPAARLRAQPAAVAVRARRDRAARPRVADLRARRGVGHRVDAGRPAPGAVGPAVQGPRRGGGRR